MQGTIGGILGFRKNRLLFYRNELAYIPGLDGLRALAVLSVICFHMNIPHMQGGFLGVALFFVLSGYLITSLLLHEWDSSFNIQLKSFWIKRAKRLLPAVFVLLICLMAYTAFFKPAFFTGLRQDIPAALFYYSNWWYIFKQVPYFSSFQIPLLNHFWSLAIEEQFYIVWPLLLTFGLNLIRNRKVLLIAILLLAVASAVEMSMLYQNEQSINRVYYGTDTRIFSLLIGCALAFIMSRHGDHVPVKAAIIVRNLLGIASLATIVAMVCLLNEYSEWLYHGGIVLFSVASAGLIACIADPSTVLSKLFALPPLRFIGKISYGIYLWQSPVIILTSSSVNTSGISAVRCLLQFGLILAGAALSYYLVEKPIRSTGIKYKDLTGFGSRRRPVGILTKASVCVLVALLSMSAVRIYGFSKSNGDHPTNPSASLSSAKDSTVSQSSQSILADRENPTDLPVVLISSTASPASTGKHAPPTQSRASQPIKASSSNDLKGDDATPITIVGDSIMFDVCPILENKYEKITLDAKVGRQFYQAQSIVQSMLDGDSLGEIVVIELGSNAIITKKEVAALIELVGSKREIIFINTRVPKPWCLPVNQVLATVTAEYPNAHLVDWYSTSTNHNEYFRDDGVHTRPTGSKAYARLLDTEIQETEKSTDAD